MELRQIHLSNLPDLETPAQKIRSDQDIEVWRTTSSYRDYSIFLQRLNESVVGYTLPWSSENPSDVRSASPSSQFLAKWTVGYTKSREYFGYVGHLD